MPDTAHVPNRIGWFNRWFFYAHRLGKAEGRKEFEAKQAKATLKGVEDARNARSKIDLLSDDAVRDRQRMRNRAK